MTAGRPRNTIESILSKHVKKAGDCWEWTGCLTIGGYGKTRAGYRHIMTHRYAYEQLVGQIPEGMFVCHRCDNRKCLNPAHLFLGTAQDNLRDSRDKGRFNAEKRYHTKPALVALIKRWSSLGMKPGKIARDLAMNNWTVLEIIRGRHWKEIA